MTFYNPFFPPFPRYPVPNSTKNSQPEEKQTPQAQQAPKTPQKQNKKNNKQKPLDLGFIRDYLQETDTLILLGLLYLLYNQEKQDFPLMFCLFLILLEP